MCYHAVPNGTHCREYITSGVCVAVVQGKPTCQSINGSSLVNLLAAETLIRETIAKRKTWVLTPHQMQAHVAVSEVR